jgi:hypothetical protein
MADEDCIFGGMKAEFQEPGNKNQIKSKSIKNQKRTLITGEHVSKIGLHLDLVSCNLRFMPNAILAQLVEQLFRK